MSSNSRSTARNKVNNDPVDELKRRSRRRLVGSIALFLAAIIIVPALVENEPARTSSEIELVVPERPATDTPAEIAQVPAKPPIDTPKQEKTEPSVVPPAVVPPAVIPPLDIDPKPEPKVEQKLEPKPEPKPEPKVEPKPEPKVEPKPEPKPEPKVESRPSEDPIAAFAKPEARTEAKAGTFWVQVAAVGDKARAESLSKEIAGKGFQSRVEATTGQAGTVYRVRVGPISGQAKADETKARLAGAGYTAARVVQ